MPSSPYHSENRGEEDEKMGLGEWIRGAFGAKPAGPPLSEQEQRGAPRGRAHQREREKQLKDIAKDMDRPRRKK